MSGKLYILFSIGFFVFIRGDCANILFLFGGGNLSQKMSIWPLARGLAAAGHNVTFVSSTGKKLSGGNLVKDITPAYFQAWVESMYKVDRVKDRLEGTHWDLSEEGYDMASLEFCKMTLKMYDEDPELRNVIEHADFELIILNAAMNECGLFLAHHMRTKFIIFSPVSMMPWFYGSYGLPLEASSIPQLMAQISYPPGFWNRLWNFYKYSFGYSRRDVFSKRLQELFQSKFKLDSLPPSLVELERRASLVFLNTHYSVDFARSLPPLFVSIGGMQCWDILEDLPIEFQDFMDGAEQGVVLITFGSTFPLSNLEPHYINIFLEAMRKLSRVRFIWRWVGPMPDGHPRNLMAAEWLPQREILNHPKTLAFMTHGGSNGINEATFHGVPLLVMPFFADQDYNAYRVSAQGVGLVIELKEFSQSLLDGAFEEILGNEKYKKNMEVRSGIFKDRRENPVQEAILWTEFALRQNDTSALKPMLLEQPWHVRTCLDVYFAYFTIFSGIQLLALFGILRCAKIITSQ